MTEGATSPSSPGSPPPAVSLLLRHGPSAATQCPCYCAVSRCWLRCRRRTHSRDVETHLHSSLSSASPSADLSLLSTLRNQGLVEVKEYPRSVHQRSGMNTLARCSRHPMCLLTLISFTFFIPIWLRTPFQSIYIDSFQQNNYDTNIALTFAISLGITIPLLVDVILDFASAIQVQYLEYRFMSAFSLAINNMIVLACLHRKDRGAVLLTCFAWSFFQSYR